MRRSPVLKPVAALLFAAAGVVTMLAGETIGGQLWLILSMLAMIEDRLP